MVAVMPPPLTKTQERLLAQVSAQAFAALRQRRRELLRELRAQGWTLPDLARLLGVTKQRVHTLLSEPDRTD